LERGGLSQIDGSSGVRGSKALTSDQESKPRLQTRYSHALNNAFFDVTCFICRIRGSWVAYGFLACQISAMGTVVEGGTLSFVAGWQVPRRPPKVWLETQNTRYCADTFWYLCNRYDCADLLVPITEAANNYPRNLRNFPGWFSYPGKTSAKFLFPRCRVTASPITCRKSVVSARSRPS
jgi:hypothetical protein